MKHGIGRKLLSVVLAVMMLVSLLPTAAFADEISSYSAETTVKEDVGSADPKKGGKDTNVGNGGNDVGNNATAVNNSSDDEADKGENEVAPQAAATTAVAKIGETEYATLQEAINAAMTDETVTLLQNVDLGSSSVKFYNSKSTNLTIDLGGHKITSAVDANGTVIVSKDGLVIKNGTIENTSSNTKDKTSAVYVTNGGTTTLESVTLISKLSGLYVCQLQSTVKTVEVVVNVENGTVIEGGNYGIKLDAPEGTTSRIHKATLNVNGGTITGTAAGVHASSPAGGKTGAVDVQITAGTVSGVTVVTNNTSYPVKATVTGGTIKGNLTSSGANNISISGGNFTGEIKQTGTPAGTITVTGGKFNSNVSKYVPAGYEYDSTTGEVKQAAEPTGVAKIGDTGYETLAAAVKNASAGETIVLLDNITLSSVQTISKQLTIDLNGKTITSTAYQTIQLKDGADLTVKDSASGGKIANAYKGSTYPATIYLNAAGTKFTLESGTIESDPYVTSLQSVAINSEKDKACEVNIKGGSVTVPEAATNGRAIVASTNSMTLNISGGTITGGLHGVDAYGGSTTNITGGTISARYVDTGVIKEAYGMRIKGTANVTVDGGEITGVKMDDDGYKLNVPNVTLKSGKINGSFYSLTKGTITFTVDDNATITFGNDTAKNFLPNTVKLVQNEDGSYGVKAAAAKVAQIGTVTYETLADAIAAAKDGDTVTLLTNCTGNGIVVEDGKFATKGLTVDFNSYSYTVGGKLVGSTGTASNGFQLLKDNKITFKNGAIYGDASVAGDDKTNWTGAPAILIQNYCDLTLENMIVTGGDETVYTMSNNNGDVVIENSTINAGKAKGYGYGPFAFDACGNGSYDGVSVTVKGNSTINGDIEVSRIGGNTKDVKLALESGTINDKLKIDESIKNSTATTTVTKTDKVELTAPTGYLWNTDGVLVAAVAKVFNADGVSQGSYESLEAAINAVQSGQTIKMLADETRTAMLKIENKNFTLDLNGCNVSDKDHPVFSLVNTELTVQDTSADASGMLYGGFNGIIVDKDSTLTVTSGTVKGYNSAVVNSGTVNIEDTAKLQRNITYSVYCNSGSVLNMTGGTVFDIGPQENHGATVKISGGEIENFAYATSVTGGTIKDLILINGCEISNATINGYIKWLDDTVPTLSNVTLGKNAYVYNKGYRFNEARTAIEAIPLYVAEVNGVKYESLQDAINAAGRKATVKMLADTRENVTISTPYLTLDLNGFTLNGSTGERKPALTVTARVTVKDSSKAQTGTIMREDTAENSGVSSHYVIDVQGAGWLTFESGTVKNGSGAGGTKGASLVRVGDDRVAKYPGLNIKGGTFTQDNFIVIKVDSGDLFLNGGTLNSANSYAVQTWLRATIKGGTVNGNVSSWTYDGGPGAETTISGGTVNGNVEAISYDGKAGKPALVSISGGTVNGTLIAGIYNSATEPSKDMATIEITGGTFSNDPTKYVVEGSTVKNNTDGTFGVEKAYLARIGETYYYTMEDAFEAQTDGDTIVLLRDYTTGSPFHSGSINRTVDLNGHTWTCTGTDANSAAFEINYPDAMLTVKNGKVVSSQLVGLIPSAMGGTITYDNSSLVFDGVEMTTTASSGIETNGNNTNDAVTLKNSTLNVPNGFGIYFPSSGTLTIDNSQITAKTMGVQVCAGSLSINDGSAITVSGDPVVKAENDGAIQDGAAISIVNRTGYKGLDKIEVTGGKFTAKAGNDAIKAYDWANKEATDFTANANVAVSGGSFSSKVPENLCKTGYIPTEADTDGLYGVKVGAYVAYDTTSKAKFESLQEAINAATNSHTVWLLEDITLTERVVVNDPSRSITLNLRGHSITAKGDALINNGKLTIMSTGDTSGTGKIVSETGVAVGVGNNAYLKITSGTFEGREGAVITSKSTGATIDIKNGTFIATDNAVIAGNGSNRQGEPNKITIKGGTFNGSIESEGYIACGIYAPWKDNITVSGGTFNIENGAGIVARAGNVKVTGGTFNCTGDGTGWVGDNKNQIPCAALVFDEKANYPALTGDSKILVSGGKFSTDPSLNGATLAAGYEAKQNEAGMYTLVSVDPVATVNGVNYGTLGKAIAAAEAAAEKGNEYPVILVKDIDDANTNYTIEGKVTINLNDHDITGSGSNGVFYVTKKGDLTITGNGTITAVESSKSAMAVYVWSTAAKVTLAGGTYRQRTTSASDHFDLIYVGLGTVEVTGGKYEGATPKWTLNCEDKNYQNGADIIVTGGTFKSFDPSANPEGKGTTYVKTGYVSTYNSTDNTYTVEEQKVAEVNDVQYTSLEAAIEAAAENGTVKLLTDVEQNSCLVIKKDITLDLNGKKIYNTVDIWSDTDVSLISIKGGAKVTITGNGTIEAKENDCYTFNVVNGGLTIENGTFVGNISAVQVQEGSLTINGGEFSLLQKMTDGKGANRYLINCIDDAYTDGSAKVAIKGGTFEDFDPNVSPEKAVDGKVPSYAAEGVGITKNENGTFTAESNMTIQLVDADGNSVKAYSSVSEGIEAATDGQTAILLTDANNYGVAIVSKNITVDFNGKTVTNNAKPMILVQGSANVVVKNGAIDTGANWAICAQGSSKLTLSDVTITGTVARDALLYVGGSAEVTIGKESALYTTNTSFSQPAIFIGSKTPGDTPKLNIYGHVEGKQSFAISGNGSYLAKTQINIFDGAVVKSEKVAMFVPQPGEVNITGGTVEGYCGIGIKSGTLNISGGQVLGVHDDDELSDANSIGSGMSYDGSAIVIDSRAAYAGDIKINISGDALIQSSYSTAIREIGENAATTSVTALNVTGGKVLGAAGKDAIQLHDVTADVTSISGGTFSSKVPYEYCAENFIPTEQLEDGTYSVEKNEGQIVARIGETGYKTLLEALTAANNAAEADGKNVILLADVNEMWVPVLSGVTLDLNGNSITCTGLFAATGNVIDTSVKKGVINAEGYTMNPANPYTPIYDSVKDGYSFFDLTVQNAVIPVNTNTKRVLFTLKNGADFNAAVTLLAKGFDSSLVKARVRITWKAQNTDQEQYFTFNDGFVADYCNKGLANPNDPYFIVTIGGLDNINVGEINAVAMFETYNNQGNAMHQQYSAPMKLK